MSACLGAMMYEIVRHGLIGNCGCRAVASMRQDGGGWNRGGKSPISLLSEPISPSSLRFEPISPSSLNINFSFSPSSLLFPPISPSSQLCLGHFLILAF